MKSRIFRIGILVLLCFPEIPARDALVYSTSFQNHDSLLFLLKGKGRLDKQGLILEPGAAFRIRLPMEYPPRNGVIHFAYRIEPIENSLVSIFTGTRTTSSLKILLGRWIVDLRDDSLRVGILDSTHSRIDSVLASASLAGASRLRRNVTLRWRDRKAWITVGGKGILEIPPTPEYWQSIGFWTAHSPLTLEYFELGKEKRDSLTVRTGYIDILATFRPDRMERESRATHHVLVWSGGKARPHGIFETAVPDSIVHRALIQAGGNPGNNMTHDAWESRFQLDSEAPDRRTAGDIVTAEVLFRGKPLALNDLLLDGSGTPLQFRFSGNGDSKRIWKSGCIICLYSCPAAKVGNASYSVRDWMRKKALFHLADTLPLLDGDEVVIRLNLPNRLRRSHPIPSVKAGHSSGAIPYRPSSGGF